MNWYKTAQKNNNWSWTRFVATFGTTVVIGLSTLWGVTPSEVKNKFEMNPKQTIFQAMEILQYQKKSFQPQVEEPNIPAEKTIPQIKNTVTDENTRPYGFNFQASQDLYDMIEKHEGKSNKVYLDHLGNPTIGIGFNLKKKGASTTLASLGVNIKDVLKGKELTDEQVYKIFYKDVDNAIKDAKSFLSTFDDQPQIVQYILVDMAFNMGINKLNEFSELKDALQKRDYQRASREMINSRWYNQVGNRSKELVQLMKGV